MARERVERSFTSGELVGRKPATIGAWAASDKGLSGKRSRSASGSTNKAKALLRKLAARGIR